MAYAEVFTALADPTRWYIFEALREAPQTVGQLAKGQPVTLSAYSAEIERRVKEGKKK